MSVTSHEAALQPIYIIFDVIGTINKALREIHRSKASPILTPCPKDIRAFIDLDRLQKSRVWKISYTFLLSRPPAASSNASIPSHKRFAPTSTTTRYCSKSDNFLCNPDRSEYTSLNRFTDNTMPTLRSKANARPPKKCR